MWPERSAQLELILVGVVLCIVMTPHMHFLIQRSVLFTESFTSVLKYLCVYLHSSGLREQLHSSQLCMVIF